MPKVRSPYAPPPRAPGKAYVKPYHHPQTGEQIGWKSSTKWGKVKYWRNTESAKAKAYKHAGLNEDAAVDLAGPGNVTPEKITGTNCKNCEYWVKDLVKLVSKDEINENGGLKASSQEYLNMSKKVDLITLPGKATVSEKAFCNNKKVMEWVTERMCCALWENPKMKREYEGEATFMEDGAVNAVGAGNIAGLGVGPQGEPGVKRSKVLKRFKKFIVGK